MNLARLLCLSVCLFVAFGSTADAKPKNPKPAPTPRKVQRDPGAPPNVIVILSDDLGANDIAPKIGYHRLHETPNLQRLMRWGVNFNRAHACPLCSPSRASLITGVSAVTHRMTAARGHLTGTQLQPIVLNYGPFDCPSTTIECPTVLDDDWMTLPEAMRDAGYVTGHFGKWHLGKENTYRPLNSGFGVDVPNWFGAGPGHYIGWSFPSYSPMPASEHVEDFTATEAVAFINANRNKPFFLNYWQWSVHSPHEAKPSLIQYYQQREAMLQTGLSPTYAAMVHSLDGNVGRILNAIENLGLKQDTIIVYMSDNGGNHTTVIPGEGLPATTNYPLRGGKGCLREGGTRVPCVIAWPGTIPASQECNDLVQIEDIYPTVLQLIGKARKPGQVFDGVSLVPALYGDSLTRQRIFTYFPHQTGVDDTTHPGLKINFGDYSFYAFFFAGENGAHRYELYDLAADPSEEFDLALIKPQLTASMASVAANYLSSKNAVMPLPNPQYGGL